MTDLCLDQKFHDRTQLKALLLKLGERNPNGRWTCRKERMGDKVIAEIYYLNGLGVFEIIPQGDGVTTFTDIRTGG